MRFKRITVNAAQMGGIPCLRGLRIPVATVVGMVADGMKEEEIIEAFPDLEQEDIQEALRYAAEAIRGTGTPTFAGLVTFNRQRSFPCCSRSLARIRVRCRPRPRLGNASGDG